MPGKDYVYAVLPGASDEDPEASEVTLALRGHTFLTGLDEARFATLAKIAQLVQFREH